MKPVDDQTRIEEIRTSLLQLLNGNFFYHMSVSQKTDEIEAFTILVNQVSKELQNAFVHQGFMPLPFNYLYLAQCVLILDWQFQLRYVDPTTAGLLYHSERTLQGSHIKHLLQKASFKRLKKAYVHLQEQPSKQQRLSLTFTTGEGLLMTIDTLVLSFQLSGEGSYVLLVGVVPKKVTPEAVILDTKASPNSTHEKLVLHPKDLQHIHQLATRISNQPEIPLPSLQELAHGMDTNEFKLKAGFKSLYGMTVFQYQRQERLRKAYVLVCHTHLSIKEVALLSGFKDATHFSFLFRKAYGMPPRKLRKQQP